MGIDRCYYSWRSLSWKLYNWPKYIIFSVVYVNRTQFRFIIENIIHVMMMVCLAYFNVWTRKHLSSVKACIWYFWMNEKQYNFSCAYILVCSMYIKCISFDVVFVCIVIVHNTKLDLIWKLWGVTNFTRDIFMNFISFLLLLLSVCVSRYGHGHALVFFLHFCCCFSLTKLASYKYVILSCSNKH